MRTSLAAFGAAVVSGLAAILLLDDVAGRVPAFEPASAPSLRAQLDSLDVAGQVAIKLNHGLRSPAYKVGLFGNSRALMVGHRDIGIEEGAFFNFAVGGAPFRQSRVLLDRLAEGGKAPRTVLISLDNLDVVFFGYAYYPRAWHRVGLSIDDGLRILRRDGLRLAISSLVNDLILIGRDAVRPVSVSAIAARAGALWGWIDGQSAAVISNHRLDGSRRQDVASSNGPLLPPTKGEMFPLMHAYFDNDLERLAELARSGTRIILYESPLAPSLAAAERVTAPDVLALRGKFLSSCERLELECHPAPILDGGDDGWPDCCHAPAERLGRYLSTMLNQKR